MPNAGSCHVLVMSLAFMFLMTASHIFTIILVFIEGLRFREFNFATIGFTCIIIVYSTFAVVILFIPPLIRVIGPKYAMLMGSFTYIIFMLSQLFPFGPTVCITSVLVGIGSALLWTGHGNYLVRNSTPRNISSNTALFWTTSQVSGIGISCCSTFLGSAFVYFRFFDTGVIDEKTRVSIIWLLFGLCCTSSIIFLLLPKCIYEDAISVCWRDKPNCLQMMFGMGKLVKSGHMLLLYVPCFLLGVNSVFLGMTYGTVVGHTMLLERPKQFAPMTGILIGLGEVIGAGSLLIFGSFNEKTRRSAVVIFGSILFILALILIFINLPNESPFGDTDDISIIECSAILIIGSSFMMGIADACFNTQIITHLSLNYQKNSASAFAVMKFFQCLGSLVAVFLGTYVVLYGVVLILVGLMIFTTTSFIVSERVDVDEDKIFIYRGKNKILLDQEEGSKSNSSGAPSPRPSPKPSKSSSVLPPKPFKPPTYSNKLSGRSFNSIAISPFQAPESSSLPSYHSLPQESASVVLKEMSFGGLPEAPKTSPTPSEKSPLRLSKQSNSKSSIVAVPLPKDKVSLHSIVPSTPEDPPPAPEAAPLSSSMEFVPIKTLPTSSEKSPLRSSKQSNNQFSLLTIATDKDSQHSHHSIVLSLEAEGAPSVTLQSTPLPQELSPKNPKAAALSSSRASLTPKTSLTPSSKSPNNKRSSKLSINLSSAIPLDTSSFHSSVPPTLEDMEETPSLPQKSIPLPKESVSKTPKAAPLPPLVGSFPSKTSPTPSDKSPMRSSKKSINQSSIMAVSTDKDSLHSILPSTLEASPSLPPQSIPSPQESASITSKAADLSASVGSPPSKSSPTPSEKSPIPPSKQSINQLSMVEIPIDKISLHSNPSTLDARGETPSLPPQSITSPQESASKRSEDTPLSPSVGSPRSKTSPTPSEKSPIRSSKQSINQSSIGKIPIDELSRHSTVPATVEAREEALSLPPQLISLPQESPSKTPEAAPLSSSLGSLPLKSLGKRVEIRQKLSESKPRFSFFRKLLGFSEEKFSAPRLIPIIEEESIPVEGKQFDEAEAQQFETVGESQAIAPNVHNSPAIIEPDPSIEQPSPFRKNDKLHEVLEQNSVKLDRNKFPTEKEFLAEQLEDVIPIEISKIGEINPSNFSDEIKDIEHSTQLIHIEAPSGVGGANILEQVNESSDIQKEEDEMEGASVLKITSVVQISTPQLEKTAYISQSEDDSVSPRVSRKTRTESFKKLISDASEETTSELESIRRKRRSHSQRSKSRSKNEQQPKVAASEINPPVAKRKKKSGMFKNLMSGPEELPKKTSKEMKEIGSSGVATRTLQRKKKGKDSRIKTLSTEESETLSSREEEKIKDNPGSSKTSRKKSMSMNLEEKIVGKRVGKSPKRKSKLT